MNAITSLAAEKYCDASWWGFDRLKRNFFKSVSLETLFYDRSRCTAASKMASYIFMPGCLHAGLLGLEASPSTLLK
jgi:hypothetical protein